MDFIDEVRTRSARFAERIDYLETEEATKNALVLPFIQMLGYSVFDPTEVVPEFTADVGTKRGEKVDYALFKDGKPIVLIECKKYGASLEQEEMSQLLRYFHVTKSHFGILTDGIVYRFFSDLDQPNVMDPKPFFEFNMLDFADNEIEELKRFTKSSFSEEETLEAAATLKYTQGMKQALIRQMNSPDEDFVRWLAKQVYSKPLMPAAKERFTILVKQSLREFINDRINARLKSALARESGDEPSVGDETEQEEIAEIAIEADSIHSTSPEELEGIEIVKVILEHTVDLERVHVRDRQSYCGILLDNNNRKPIIRLGFNNSESMRICIFEFDDDGSRRDEWHSIDAIEQINVYADQIRMAVEHYIETDE